MLYTNIAKARLGIPDVVVTFWLIITQLCYCFYIYSDMEAKFRERDEREEQLIKAKEKLENDIAEILNDTDATPEESLNIIIENSNKSCPLDMQNGMVMTDIRLVDGILFSEITVDEDRYSMAALESNMETIRQNMINLIQQEQDIMTAEMVNCLVKTNNGMGDVYIGNKSQYAVRLVFTSEELRTIVKNK